MYRRIPMHAFSLVKIIEHPRGNPFLLFWMYIRTTNDV